MMKKIGTITNSNEIFFYFEMLRNLNPKRVLDVGMFLKRIGSVSRQVMTTELPPGMKLDGIDLFASYRLPIYNTVYDNVLTDRTFFEQLRKTGTYVEPVDVVVMLEIEDVLEPEDKELLWSYIYQYAGGVMTEVGMAEEQVRKGKIRGYYPVGIGNTSFAWIPIAEVKK